MDDEIWTLLSLADRALGRLDGSTETLPNPDLFVYMYVRKEAVLSSQIEGTQASLMDVLEFEEDSLRQDRTQDVAEVVNYVAAMNHGLARLPQLPLSLRLIKEIHGLLLKGVRGSEWSPGEFRRSQNWIGPPGCTLAQALYVPPPVADMQDALSNLETFLHDQKPMPVLVKVGMAHSQKKKVLNRPLLYLSYYFKQNRAEYYDRLQAVRDRGDWEGWLKFFLRGVYDVAQEATATARRIVNLREKHRGLITAKLGRGAAKALALFEKLYFGPVITVRSIEEITHLSFSNANRLAKQLCETGILREMTGRKRNRRFVYGDYLALFEDAEVKTPAI